jgi:hypothetical protein
MHLKIWSHALEFPYNGVPSWSHEEKGLQNQASGIKFCLCLFIHCATLGKLLIFSEPWFL